MLDLFFMAAVFVFSFVVGYLLISKVPTRLHTPLMSMTNAISAITILGGILLFAVETTLFQKILGVAAIALAAFNTLGGFVITDRMLRLFKRKEPSS
ncbi:MAG: NAD(P) transhydrogenase subunit alpha [Pirellulales bacterium]|nr:NAD(P) transhydrogenase subunit alpha [Pirellulales bacterium]